MVGDIFTKAKDQSILLSLGREIPVSINETVITTGDTFPEAGQVGGTTLASREGAEKPLQGIGFGTSKSFSPIKLAVIVTVGDEFAKANVDGLYTDLAAKLSGAIARAADLAAFHNRDAITGLPLIGTTASSYVNATSNRVELNFRRDAAPDLVDQLLAGVDLVEDDEAKNFEVSGFAAVSRMRTKLATQRDKNGNPVFIGDYPGSGAQINLRARMGNLFGVPIAFGRSVKGKLGAYAGSKVKMFAGDWTQLAWGFADEIRVKVSDQATVGGVSMWQTNQIAVLAEATFGWIVNDTAAFVAYDDAVVDAAPA
ncbi:HK97 family phage major capsid protein [Actinokineospora baliensis]|uniref:phage major capsid family protein n=1 Tax=Actinokineospora baliensis TaxID=547056 RepID=UPI001957DC45|nr:phage major capsid protein [Actinokineospora baliensis]MBM7771972.1 HK97 family phage major capsid protein [Actinokineospora baliensis]